MNRALRAVWLAAVAAVIGPAALAADPYLGASGEADHRVHVRLDTDATWGIGGQMFLGASAHGTGYVGAWNTPHATGSVDVGLQLHYQNEPVFLAFWIDPTEVTGAVQRVQAVATVGHTFHMGGRRQVALGVRWFAGLNHWDSTYTVNYANEGVQGKATVRDDLFVTGAQVDVAYRCAKHVGVNLQLNAPMPTASSYAITFGSIGAGLSWYLR
jgi:hypothetical protein